MIVVLISWIELDAMNDSGFLRSPEVPTFLSARQFAV